MLTQSKLEELLELDDEAGQCGIKEDYELHKVVVECRNEISYETLKKIFFEKPVGILLEIKYKWQNRWSGKCNGIPINELVDVNEL